MSKCAALDLKMLEICEGGGWGVGEERGGGGGGGGRDLM